MHTIRRAAQTVLMPSQNALSVFLIAVTLLALLTSNDTFQAELFDSTTTLDKSGRETSSGSGAGAIFVIGLIAVLIISLWRILIDSPVGYLQKSLMQLFVIAACGVGGVSAGVHVLENSSGVWLVFPAINIANAVALLYFSGVFSEDIRFDDRNISAEQAIAGIVTTLGIWALCQLVFNLYWSLTFSICAAHIAILNEAIHKVFPVPAAEQ